MASTTVDSIPTVDLRHLSQSELTSLSLFSSQSTFNKNLQQQQQPNNNDVIIPQLDPTTFNESAGSRKQTFSRLRLRLPPSKFHPPHDSDSAENSLIVSLFKHLFFSSPSDVSAHAIVPAFHNVIGAREKKKRKRGRQPNNNNNNDKFALPERGRYEVAGAGAGAGAGEAEDVGLVNKNGNVVNLRELASAEDPYGEELRRRTEGKETAEEILGFITELEGEWGSRRKKRKVVDANVFGDVLPNGWKVLIAMKKRAGRAWVFCRRYIRFGLVYGFVVRFRDCC